MASLLRAETDIAALRDEVNNINAELSDTLKQLDDANAELQRSVMKLVEQQEYAASLEVSNASYRQSVHELQSSVDMLNVELGNAKSEMHVLILERNNLESSLTSKSNQLDELHVSCMNLESELRKHKDVIALINKISNKPD